MQEKRRFRRLDVELPVTLRCGGRLVPATALNISCGGVCIDVESNELDLTGKKKVEVIIDLAQGERDVSLRGEIIRVEGDQAPRLGIKFTNLYTVGHQTLEKFINRSCN